MTFISGIWNNRMWKRDGHYMLDTNTFPVVQSANGDLYHVSEDLFTVEQCRDYHLSDIRKSDVVVDLGANIGGFTIPAAKMAKVVYAYEPVRGKELLRNVQLNNLSNVYDYSLALSDLNVVPVQWRGENLYVAGTTFESIKKTTWFIDVLKCDCEGAEKFISPHELDGIRLLEIEFHKPFYSDLIEYIKEHWKTDITPVNTEAFALHGRL